MIFGTAKYNSIIVAQQVRLISDLILIQFSKSKKSNMEEKKCYISLPITGRDIEKVKKDIERIKIQLIHNGYSPVSPFDREINFNATHEQHMREDFKLLLDCDAIYMADEWTNSKGCKAEFDCALACGIKPIFSLYSILQW